MRLGQLELGGAQPGSGAEQAAAGQRLVGEHHLIIFAAAEQPGVDPLGRDGIEEIGPDQTADTGDSDRGDQSRGCSTDTAYSGLRNSPG